MEIKTVSPQRRKDAKDEMNNMLVHCKARLSSRADTMVTQKCNRLHNPERHSVTHTIKPLRLENMFPTFSTDYIHVTVCVFAVRSFGL